MKQTMPNSYYKMAGRGRWILVGGALSTLALCYLAASWYRDPNLLLNLDLSRSVTPNRLLNPPPSFSAKLHKRLPSCPTDVFPNTILRRNDIWQILKHKDGSEVCVFGAYLDDRESVSREGVVRVFGVTSIKNDVKVICQFWYDPNEAGAEEIALPVEVESERESVGRGFRMKSLRLQEEFYTCPLPRNIDHIPINVSLVFERCDQSTTLVEIMRPDKRTVHDIGVCVAVSYGTIDPYRLVEWIELNRILGVGEFNLYDSRLHLTTRHVLDYYQTQGIVNVRTSAPAIDSWCHWCQKLSVIPAFSDCLYRNMYRYNYTLIIDVDEFIVPKKELTIREFINNHGENPDPPAAYMFHNAYFFLDFDDPGNYPDNGVQDPANKDNMDFLVTMNHVNRMPASPQGYSPKSLINPRKCVVAQNHYCAVRTPDVGRYWTTVVDPETALSHHYKECHFDKAECGRLRGQEHVRDETVRRYAGKLREAVEKAVKGLKEKGVLK